MNEESEREPITAETSEDSVAARFRRVRQRTAQWTQHLQREDFLLQSMPEASPIAWHLAHTTWFFEEFVLAPFVKGFQPHHPKYAYLFNSYYEAVGQRVARPHRGLLSRPTLPEIFEYRHKVEAQIEEALASGGLTPSALAACELGTHHEEQHQELMVTDLLHAFWHNPLRPQLSVNERSPLTPPGTLDDLRFIPVRGGIHEIGAPTKAGFHFDNEGPRHSTLLHDFEIAQRPITNREWLAFIDDGGYQDVGLWLSDGWARAQSPTDPWHAPLYWERSADGRWQEFTACGMGALDLDAPVRHVSHYEANAFARWSKARLPTEAEWECALATYSTTHGAFYGESRFVPQCSSPLSETSTLIGMLGSVWEWTASPYVGYPEYVPTRGALGEYNGKFMSGQMVLRGGSCATPMNHIRPSYRNFFAPDARWQFSGVRLARNQSSQ